VYATIIGQQVSKYSSSLQGSSVEKDFILRPFQKPRIEVMPGNDEAYFARISPLVPVYTGLARGDSFY
jgi:hypothetical protein